VALAGYGDEPGIHPITARLRAAISSGAHLGPKKIETLIICSKNDERPYFLAILFFAFLFREVRRQDDSPEGTLKITRK
jgi:hypothetical protein